MPRPKVDANRHTCIVVRRRHKSGSKPMACFDRSCTNRNFTRSIKSVLAFRPPSSTCQTCGFNISLEQKHTGPGAKGGRRRRRRRQRRRRRRADARTKVRRKGERNRLKMHLIWIPHQRGGKKKMPRQSRRNWAQTQSGSCNGPRNSASGGRHRVRYIRTALEKPS